MKALISVSDKTGIVEFAKELENCGVEIISTGGTYKKLKENGVAYLDWSALTYDAEGAKTKEDIYDIDATIYCLRKSHKGIIIGKNGTMLKKIGMYAREDLEKMFGTKVNLKTWVKVNEDWQEKDSIVKNFQK